MPGIETSLNSLPATCASLWGPGHHFRVPLGAACWWIPIRFRMVHPTTVLVFVISPLRGHRVHRSLLHHRSMNSVHRHLLYLVPTNASLEIRPVVLSAGGLLWGVIEVTRGCLTL